MPLTPEQALEQRRIASKRGTEAVNQKYQAFLDELKIAIGEIGHLPNSTSLLCKRFKKAPTAIKQGAARLGIDLPAMRKAWAELHPSTPEDQKPAGLNPERERELTHLPWTILELFDRLMHHFRAVEGDEDAKDEGDLRRTWVAWRVFLAAAFGRPMEELALDHSKTSTNEIARIPDYPGVPSEVPVPRGAAAPPAGASAWEIFTSCTGRKVWPTIQARILSLIVGRRGGKSYITAIIGIYLACCRKYSLNLGTKGMVMILAKDKEQAGVIRSYILAFLRAHEQLRFMLKGEVTQKLIELQNGITIEIRAVGEAGTRGYTVVSALCDEIAFWPTDPDSAKQDKKVLRALRPAMLGIKGAMLVMLSSPYAKRGELWENFRKFYGKDTGPDNPRTLVWQADTLTMRPSDDADLVEEISTEYEEDPESAKAEYGGLFRADLESIFRREIVEACCVPGRVELGATQARKYRAFVDPSGGSADSYVVAIAHEEQRTVQGEKVTITVLDKVREWLAPFDPEQVSKEAASMVKEFKIRKVTGDAYGGEWPRAPFRKAGIDYEVSEKNRSELYLDLLPVINAARCELLDSIAHKRMINQMINLERRTGRTGKDSVDHPPGGHDDVANAVAGVVVMKGYNAVMGCTW